MTGSAEALAAELAQAYAALPGVRAVALGGSRSMERADAESDLDLYVYSEGEVPLEARRTIAQDRADHAEVGNAFFESGDEWFERGSGQQVDVTFRRTDWLEDELARVLDRHQPSLGYTTAVWSNVLHARPLVDPQGWYAGVRARAAQPYPEALAQAIIAHNFPLLRGNIGAYPVQIALAVRRADLVAVNHRLAALLASVFDVLFALNRQPHPGEKRLLAYAADLPLCPPAFAAQVTAALTVTPDTLPELPARVEALVDGLEDLLIQRGERP